VLFFHLIFFNFCCHVSFFIQFCKKNIFSSFVYYFLIIEFNIIRYIFFNLTKINRSDFCLFFCKKESKTNKTKQKKKKKTNKTKQNKNKNKNKNKTKQNKTKTKTKQKQNKNKNKNKRKSKAAEI
jgi:hypothetical protein